MIGGDVFVLCLGHSLDHTALSAFRAGYLRRAKEQSKGFIGALPIAELLQYAN